MIGAPRYHVLAILSLAYFLCYLARMAMASAIPFIAQDLQLSPLAMGGVLSAFFAGYSMMQIPGGLLTDRFGPNRVLTLAIALWSLLSAATALATALLPMLALRALFGAAEAPFPAAAAKALTIWFPPHQLGRANGVMLASTQLGASLAPVIVAGMVIVWGWRSAFLSLLLPGMLLAWLIRHRVTDRPDAGRAPTADSATVISALRNPAVLWCFLAAFFSNLAAWGLFSWLPTYLLRARGFGVEKLALYGALPYLAGALGYFLSGQLSDRYFRRRRHLVVPAGLILSALSTLAAASATSGDIAVTWLAPAFLFLAIADAGINTLPMVIVPLAAVGAAFGLINSAAQLAGFLSPLLVGTVLTLTSDDFTLVFHGFVAALLAAAIAALFIRQRDAAARA
jgi:sugar phosphate permease